MAQEEPGGGVGWVVFAAVLMLVAGFFAVIQGFVGIVKKTFYVVSPNYVVTWNAQSWGWIHLLLGILVILAGLALFRGATWARIVGIVLASLSTIANFFFIPYYPLWALIVITMDVIIIWALCARAGQLRDY